MLELILSIANLAVSTIATVLIFKLCKEEEDDEQ